MSTAPVAIDSDPPLKVILLYPDVTHRQRLRGCMKLKDKVALVTGTSPNIGGGITEGLAAEGASLVCVDASIANATDCAKYITGTGGKSDWHHLRRHRRSPGRGNGAEGLRGVPTSPPTQPPNRSPARLQRLSHGAKHVATSPAIETAPIVSSSRRGSGRWASATDQPRLAHRGRMDTSNDSSARSGKNASTMSSSLSEAICAGFSETTSIITIVPVRILCSERTPLLAVPCRSMDRSRPSPFSVDFITNTSEWPKW